MVLMLSADPRKSGTKHSTIILELLKKKKPKDKWQTYLMIINYLTSKMNKVF